MENKTYICLLRSEEGGCKAPASPTEMEVMLAKYNAWQEKFSDNILDMGEKLGGASSFSPSRQTCLFSLYAEAFIAMTGIVRLDTTSIFLILLWRQDYLLSAFEYP